MFNIYFGGIGGDDLTIQIEELGKDPGFCVCQRVLRLAVRREIIADENTFPICQAEHILLESHIMKAELYLSELHCSDVIEVFIHEGNPVIERVGAGLFQFSEHYISYHVIVLPDRLYL